MFNGFGFAPRITSHSLNAICAEEGGEGDVRDNVQHLRDHNIEPEEAEDCLFHRYDLASDDRRFSDVYILDGRTDRGRRLRLVFQDKGNRLARVFTGWELKPKPKLKRKR